MSITRSFNKHTNTYYAYDTIYEWSEELQKNVQRKKCIGQYDSEGNVVPNGKRGRPVKRAIIQKSAHDAADTPVPRSFELTETLSRAEALYTRIKGIEDVMSQALKELNELRSSVGTLVTQLRTEHGCGEVH